MAPSRAAWLGATLGVAVVSLALWLSALVDLLTPDSTAGPVLIVTLGILVAVAFGGLTILAWAIFRQSPLYFRWTALAAMLLLAGTFLIVPLGPVAFAILIVATLTIAAVTGGTIAVVGTGGWRASNRAVRCSTAILGLLGLGAAVFAAACLALPGSTRPELLPTVLVADSRTAPNSLANPADRGEFEVKLLIYGSGNDSLRHEFGAGAALTTKPVDASKVLKGWSGITGWWRTRFWKFDAKALPLNGRVWFPAADGPFPLVLIVHGNHLASDFSEGGYGYLGELLASRGFIVVSVDENFLNSMETDLWSGLEKENNARGWLLLEHLRQWHAWNKDPSNPFYGKVDTERIALVGHSRGGEAVAHAAAFNRLPYNPDNAEAKFEYGYHIRSVVAIAPIDGQYKPSGIRTPLEDVSYLTIHGSHDSDVSSYFGLRQFDRVKFKSHAGAFKSAVYIYGANHGQFNSGWGAFDTGAGIVKRIINTRALLSEDDQRQIAKVYLSAFFECTLRDSNAYRPLFRDARFGATWLPRTMYLTQYADARTLTICDYEEDLNLSTGSLSGTQIAGNNLTKWREALLELRDGLTENRAVVLGWDRDVRKGLPEYSISWPAETLQPATSGVLSFALADANEDPLSDEQREQSGPRAAEKRPRPPIDLTLELTDAGGHSARLPLGHYALLPAQIETPYLKSTLQLRHALSEPIFQTYFFPTADFSAASAEFDPTKIVRLRFLFDLTTSGVVILDRVALGPAQ